MSHENSYRHFPDRVRLFLDACPGPPMLRVALRVAALQPVAGIPGIETHETGPSGLQSSVFGKYSGKGGTSEKSGRYLSTVVQVGERLAVCPKYLSKAARQHGYSFSHALRWARHLHAVTLLEEGERADRIAWRLGFNDYAGWSRFTERLLGRSPRQLPVLPLRYWVNKAIEDVFFGNRAGGRAAPEQRGRNDK